MLFVMTRCLPMPYFLTISSAAVPAAAMRPAFQGTSSAAGCLAGSSGSGIRFTSLSMRMMSLPYSRAARSLIPARTIRRMFILPSSAILSAALVFISHAKGMSSFSAVFCLNSRSLLRKTCCLAVREWADSSSNS